MDRVKPCGALFDGKAIPGVAIVFEARGSFASGQSVQAIRTVHPVGTPEDQWNTARACVLENMDGAEPIVGDVEEWIRITRDDRRLGASVANQLYTGWKIVEVLRIAHIPVRKGD